MTKLSKGMIGSTVAGLVLALSPMAQAETVTLRTDSLRRPDNGYLYCIVNADSVSSMDVTTTVLTRGSANVTDFGSAVVTSPVVSGDGRYHVENTAGSVDKRAASCQVVATTSAPAGDMQVSVTLEARDVDGNVVKSVSIP